MKELEVFHGLEEISKTISLGRKNYFYGILQTLKLNPITYKLSRPAYTSKVLAGLLKQEYETRVTFANGSFIGKPFPPIIKL